VAHVYTGAAGAQSGANQGTNQGGNAAGQLQGGNNATGQAAGQASGQGTPSQQDLATAVLNWQADTSAVSNFLNTGKGIQDNTQFKKAAKVAFDAEVDELTHKAIIDQANSADPNVIAANDTLATAGAFQDVVDRLQLMATQGRSAVDNIDAINFGRCANVLPNIDAYMASTGSDLRAIRPLVCDQTGVVGGNQGSGATQPPAGQPGNEATPDSLRGM
jgi:hypothetical protein